MTDRRARCLVALLPLLLRDDDPLLGDLIEESSRRSLRWLWCQVRFVVYRRLMTSTSACLREPQRLGPGLSALGMLAGLIFQVVVAGSLLDDLMEQLVPVPRPWFGPAGVMLVVLLSLPSAWLVGCAVRWLHPRSRLATVLICGASAAIAAALTLTAFGPGGYLPAAGLQGTTAMVFVLVVLAGSRVPANAIGRSRAQGL